MKNAVKYLVLSISCVICFVLSVIEVALLLDMKNLSYPATLIVPTISYVIFIAGLVMLTVWAFKFSNNQQHKLILIISLGLLVASIVVFMLGKIVNAKITEAPKAETAEVSETEYFDFDATTLVSEIEKSNVDLTAVSIVDNEETGEKTATYTSQKDTYTTDENVDYPPMHYLVTYDGTTEKVSFIYFFIDINSENAYKRFFSHIYNTVLSIESFSMDYGEDWAELGEIENKLTNGDQNFTYRGDEFFLYASKNDKHLSVSFTPNQTKGE